MPQVLNAVKKAMNNVFRIASQEIEIERKSDEIAREREKERERELCDWNRDIEKMRELREREIERLRERIERMRN